MRATDVCPARRLTSLGLSPAAIYRLMAVCLVSWIRSGDRPARSTAGCQKRRRNVAAERGGPQDLALGRSEHEGLGVRCSEGRQMLDKRRLGVAGEGHCAVPGPGLGGTKNYGPASLHPRLLPAS